MSSSDDERLRALLAEHCEWLTHDAANGKVLCTLSGHAMPARASAVSQYVRCERHRARLRTRVRT